MNMGQARASPYTHAHHLISYNWKLVADHSIEKSQAWNDGKVRSGAHLQSSAIDAALVERQRCMHEPALRIKESPPRRMKMKLFMNY